MDHMLQQILYILKRPYHFVKTGLLKGLPAQIKAGFPAKKLTILAVTGTDGKTTSSTMLYHVLKESKKKVGLVSTVGAYIGKNKADTGFHVTSPQPDQLQYFMKELVDKKYEYLVLEVTSHGAYQFRTWGAPADIAGVTNIAREHLDYHGSYEAYVAAKALILKQAKSIILNTDDSSYRLLRPLLGTAHVTTYGSDSVDSKKVQNCIESRFPESYNQMNAKLVYHMAGRIGITDEEFCAAIKTFPGVPGRLETVAKKNGIEIIVDFAHTPQGVNAVLTALRKKTKGRLIVVLGCAGLRDTSKRPEMGRLAVELADFAVFTAEDPRTEDVWSIIREMKENLTENHSKIVSIADRREAIEFALTKIAKKGDIVAILGKGHEESMCYGKTEVPWSDKKAVLEILKI